MLRIAGEDLTEVTEAGAWAEVEIDLRGRVEMTRRRMLTTRMERRVGEAEAAEDSEDTGRATSAGEESQEGTRRATAPREMRQIVRGMMDLVVGDAAEDFAVDSAAEAEGAAGSVAVEDSEEDSEAEVTASVVGSGEGAEDVEDSVAVVEDQAEKAAHETSHFLFYQHHQINVFGKCFNTNCYLFSIKSSINTTEIDTFQLFM